jgi:hypothetical protein
MKLGILCLILTACLPFIPILLMDGMHHAQDWELLSEVQLPGAEEQLAAGGDAPFGDVRITWRGDGKYFATTHRTPKEG